MIYHEGQDDLAGIEDAVRITVRNLKTMLEAFDSIVVTGMSGVVVGIPVGLRLKKPVVIVRKPSEYCHAARGSIINRHALGKRVLFLGDFVSGGETRSYVESMVRSLGAKVIAEYLYRDHQYNKQPFPF